MPVYNDDEDASDFNGLGYRANDTISSVSEDYENQSVNVSVVIGLICKCFSRFFFNFKFTVASNRVINFCFKYAMIAFNMQQQKPHQSHNPYSYAFYRSKSSTTVFCVHSYIHSGVWWLGRLNPIN